MTRISVPELNLDDPKGGLPTVENGHANTIGMPLRTTVTVNNPHGLHMRPAMVFARLASRFQSTVTIRKPERTANGKSMMQIMTLAATPGMELILEVDGDDAAAALPVLAAALAAPSADAM
jgi:phosphotransferase system HPr (HPr) family protein